MAELIVKTEGVYPPKVSSNTEVIKTSVFVFKEDHFTKDFEDPQGSPYSKIIIESLPEFEIYNVNTPLKIGDSFFAQNAPDIRINLNDRYAIHNGHLYRFYKNIDSIIADYNALSLKLLNNAGGILTFINENNKDDIRLVFGVEVSLSGRTFSFKTRALNTGLDSNVAAFSLLPSENTNIKANQISFGQGTQGKNAYELAIDNGFSGSVADWLLSLVGQKGDPGAQGLTGPKGADGTSVTILGSKATTGDLPPSGNTYGDGYIIDLNLWVWDGANWIDAGEIKGPQGDQGVGLQFYWNGTRLGVKREDDADYVFTELVGPQGKSPYQLAVDNGYIGSVTQWLASLVGPAGPPGPPGNDGQDGQDAEFSHVETPFDYTEGDPQLFTVDDTSLITDVYGKGYRLERDNPDGSPDEWRIVSATQIEILIDLENNDRITIVASTTKTIGLKGERGDDAYEIALQEGFVGTRAEWAASLPGKGFDNIPAIANRVFVTDGSGGGSWKPRVHGAPLPVSTSRELNAEDNGKSLYINSIGVNLTYPAGGLGNEFACNLYCNTSGSLGMLDTNGGNDLEAPKGTLLTQGAMGHAFVNPDGKLELAGDFDI